MLLDKTNMCEK